MKGETYFIDTNIIMYARGKEHPYQAVCSHLLLGIADASFRNQWGIPVVDTEVFQEIIYRYGMENRWETAVAVSRDLAVIGVEILPIGREELQILMALAEKYGGKGVHPRDLVHASVMISNGVRKIITADTHFDLLAEVERVDPLKFL